MWILIEIDGNDAQKIGRDELRRLISFEEVEAEKSYSTGSSLIKGTFSEARPATPPKKERKRKRKGKILKERRDSIIVGRKIECLIEK